MKVIYIILIIVVLILYILVSYIKNICIYVPYLASHDKYEKFYHKIYKLTESPNNIKNIFIQTPDNILLDTLYLKNPDTDICIIYFHGNAGNLAMRYDMINFLYNFGSVVIFDYRSFGRSSGNLIGISESTMGIDAETIWSYVIHNFGYKPTRISLFGESLGCSIVLCLATNLSKTLDESQYPHSLILNSPFYSLDSIIKVIFEKVRMSTMGNLLSVMYGTEYKSDSYIQYINHITKIIIAHSPRDEIIPHKEGYNLYKLISDIHPNIKFINVLGTHNNLCLTDSYIYALSNLFQ